LGTFSHPYSSPCSTTQHTYKRIRIIRCGNGLLTHILISEGTRIDVHARTSWAKYPPSTRAHLHVHAFDPTRENPNPNPHLHTTECEWAKRDQHRGTFLIKNHADELSPWLPVLAAAHHASGYVSIPCCAWLFDMRFDRSVPPPFPPFPHVVADDTTNAATDTGTCIDSLNFLGVGTGAGGGGKRGEMSTYTSYRIWLASLSLYCGWKVECEVLRIPSTRNWAIVGRRRVSENGEDGEERARAINIIDTIRARGSFKSRKPEGVRSHH
jgi:tRNASer (uridine44-2'-O)-methyltransferase